MHSCMKGTGQLGIMDWKQYTLYPLWDCMIAVQEASQSSIVVVVKVLFFIPKKFLM